MESLNKMNSEKIHLTLTLGEVTELINAGLFCINRPKESKCNSYLTYAVQKLDAAVNE